MQQRRRLDLNSEHKTKGIELQDPELQTLQAFGFLKVASWKQMQNFSELFELHLCSSTLFFIV